MADRHLKREVPADDGEFDVIVIGGGGAGLAAAITAADHGMRTCLFEARPVLGGSTSLSIGSFTAANTKWQRRQGIVDSVDDFLIDMAAFPGVQVEEDSPELRAVLAGESASTLHWLHGLGIPFVGPFPEPPHRVPRMHNVVPDSRMYIRRLESAAVQAGVRIYLNSPVTDLVCDAFGHGVVGVCVRKGESQRNVVACHGVILATGDFAGGAEMRSMYLSPAAAAAVPANPHNTGAGHRMAAKVGAQLCGMSYSSGPKIRFRAATGRGVVARLPLSRGLMEIIAWFVQRAPAAVLRPYIKAILVAHMQPSPGLFSHGAILVNTDGDRFCDEVASTLPLATEPEAMGYIVFDERIAQAFRRAPNYISTAPGIAYAYLGDYQRARPELVHMADNVAGLALQLGLRTDRLSRAVASAPQRFEGRLYALGPAVSTVTVTEGGIRVDSQCRALACDGSVIEGLYAVGGVGQGGMRLAGHGLHIAWAMTSGRIAGRGAATRLPIRRADSPWHAELG